MPIPTINFQGHIYPAHEAEGFASQWIMPIAQRYCKGKGYDIGCNRLEWILPGARPIDPAIEGCPWDAYNLPDGEVDFVFSSHCLEHLPNYVKALEYWQSKLKSGAMLVLYLPADSQRYWLPIHNKKHLHSFNSGMMRQLMDDIGGWRYCLVTEGWDVNHSFTVIAEKA